MKKIEIEPVLRLEAEEELWVIRILLVARIR